MFASVPIIVQAAESHTATVIFLHGLGDSGLGWQFLAHEFRRMDVLRHVKFVFPNAPMRRVTCNMNELMPAWYDIKSLDGFVSLKDESVVEEDEENLIESSKDIQRLITNEIENGISSERIVVGGFSQGCVVSILAGLSYEKKLAGIAGLSGHIPLVSKLKSMISADNYNTKIFLGHGDQDLIIKYSWGQRSAETLKQWKLPVTFNTYSNMGHSCNMDELDDLKRFLNEVIPNGGTKNSLK